MKRYALIILLLCATVAPLCAQRHAREDYEFGTYLLGGGLMRDALTLTNSLDDNYTPAALDTMRYLKGWTLYHNQRFTQAATAFGAVGNDSPFWPQSSLFGAVCLLESGDTQGAKLRLEEFSATPACEPYRDIVAFEREGIALLEGNLEEYHIWRSAIDHNSFVFAEEQQRLDEVAAHRPLDKKPWVAAVASAVIPGLGQIYAGNVGEGVASFLAVGAFAALTATSWHRADTPLNWRTITYGSIGSLLYIGNIFGSVASVRIYHQRIETINSEAVMYSIHIPMRSIFY